jgi:hypothetical protein
MVSAGGYPLKEFTSDHDDMITRDAGAGRIKSMKKKFLKSYREFYSHHFGPFTD